MIIVNCQVPHSPLLLGIDNLFCLPVKVDFGVLGRREGVAMS